MLYVIPVCHFEALTIVKKKYSGKKYIFSRTTQNCKSDIQPSVHDAPLWWSMHCLIWHTTGKTVTPAAAGKIWLQIMFCLPVSIFSFLIIIEKLHRTKLCFWNLSKNTFAKNEEEKKMFYDTFLDFLLFFWLSNNHFQSR